MATFSGEVHPVAAMFPMLDEDELNELAADIKANGLLYPIIIDRDGVLIDGRNRLAACEKAKVKPAFETLNGTDPVAYILSTNIARRHLTKGQRAMAVARACFETKQTVRGLSAATGVSAGRIGFASTVLQFAPDLADGIMAGSIPLDQAYEEARKRKTEAETRDEQAKRAQAELARLKAEAPDLADLVTEERMKLSEAVAAAKERREEEEEAAQRASHDFAVAVVQLWAALDADPTSIAERWRPDSNPHRLLKHVSPLWTSKGLRKLSDDLNQLADHLDANHKGKL